MNEAVSLFFESGDESKQITAEMRHQERRGRAARFFDVLGEINAGFAAVF